MANNSFWPHPDDPRFKNEMRVLRGSPEYMAALYNQTPSHYLPDHLLRRKAWVRSNAARWEAEQEAIMRMQVEKQQAFLQQQIDAATVGMQQLMRMMEVASAPPATLPPATLPPAPPTPTPATPTPAPANRSAMGERLAKRNSGYGAVVMSRPPPPGHYVNRFGRFVRKGFRYNERDQLVDMRTPMTEYLIALEEFWETISAENLTKHLLLITGLDEHEGPVKIRDLLDQDKLNFTFHYNGGDREDEIVRGAVYLSHLVVLRHYFKKLLELAESDRIQAITVSANVPDLPQTVKSITKQIAKYDAMILGATLALNTAVGEDIDSTMPVKEANVNLTAAANAHIKRLAGTKRRRGNINGPGAPPIIPRGTKKGRYNAPISAPKQTKPNRPRPGEANVSTTYPAYTLRNDPGNNIKANAERIMGIAYPQIWNQYRRFKKRIRQDPYLPRGLLTDKTHEITRVDLAEDNTIRVYVRPVIKLDDPALGTYYGHLVGARETLLPAEEFGDLRDLWDQMSTKEAFEDPIAQREYNNASRAARLTAATAPLEDGMFRINEGARVPKSVPVRRLVVDGVETYVPINSGSMDPMSFTVSATGATTRRVGRGGKRSRCKRSGKRMRTRSGKRSGKRTRKIRRNKRPN